MLSSNEGIIEVVDEAYKRKMFMNSIILHSPVADQAFVPHMKAMCVPFHSPSLSACHLAVPLSCTG